MEQRCESGSPLLENPSSFADIRRRKNIFVALQGVPEPEGLEERLLCVETSETSPHITRAVMGAVASVASFAGFLPLANRVREDKCDV